jgi:hypothetical protein
LRKKRMSCARSANFPAKGTLMRLGGPWWHGGCWGPEITRGLIP